jgi:hypothetical protein
VLDANVLATEANRSGAVAAFDVIPRLNWMDEGGKWNDAGECVPSTDIPRMKPITAPWTDLVSIINT